MRACCPADTPLLLNTCVSALPATLLTNPVTRPITELDPTSLHNIAAFPPSSMFLPLNLYVRADILFATREGWSYAGSEE